LIYFLTDNVPLEIFPWAKWCWQPFNCTTEKFSKKGFCDLINGLSILFVGDSISYQMYQSLYMQLGEPGQPQDQGMHHPSYEHSKSFICKRKSRMAFIRNDHIRSREKNPNPSAKGDRYRDYTKIMNTFDIIVFNKGAHVATSTEDFTTHTLETIKYLQTHAKDQLIYFRTTPQGHVGCTRQSEVNTTLLLTPPVLLTKEMAIYDWDIIPSRNKIAVEAFLTLPNARILDVVPMTSLRPDGHRFSDKDCLHYWLPSVIDNWSYYFYNSLIQELKNHTKVNNMN